jgi:hypothetical protein
MKRFTNVDSPCFKLDSIQMAVHGNQNINDIHYDGAFLYTKLNPNLNLGDGYLYGDATTTTGSISYKINIQQGWPDITLIVQVPPILPFSITATLSPCWNAATATSNPEPLPITIRSNFCKLEEKSTVVCSVTNKKQLPDI